VNVPPIEIPPPNITISSLAIPEQKAPVVHVAAAKVVVPEIRMPEIKVPDVTVNVSPTPVTIVNEIKIPTTKTVKVKRGNDGKISEAVRRLDLKFQSLRTLFLFAGPLNVNHQFAR